MKIRDTRMKKHKKTSMEGRQTEDTVEEERGSVKA
jgi:hypothetical protein